ncbi:MAG TPA: glycosyltransferase family A protein [Gemmataceae bacterium]
MPAPTLSLIVPTRGRRQQLRIMLESVCATARHPERLEVILVVDDDEPHISITSLPNLNIRIATGPPGRTMGALNNDGYRASRGDYIMLLNDDVIIRTRDWDRLVYRCFRRFPDPIALVHVNDTLMRDFLCTFPILSRAYCELMGGICPTEYERYRIDDHIEDVFNILAYLGVRRSIYLPDVIFEHCNTVNHPTAGAVYESDPAILARDAPRFEKLLPRRKEQAIKAIERIEGNRNELHRTKLSGVTDSFALRTAGRQHVIRAPWMRRAPGQLSAVADRLRCCYQRAGIRGIAKALIRRLHTSGLGSGLEK